MTPTAFFSALYQGVSSGYLELRHCLPGKPSIFLRLPYNDEQLLGYMDRLRTSAEAKPYFGIAVRSEKDGTTRSCGLATAIYIDADFKHATEAQWREAFASHPYPPSAVIMTGGGFQAYWFLTEPFYLTGNGAPQVWTRTLERWFLTFPHDADDLSDVARVFRIPGTLNRKYDPPREAVVDYLDPETRYSFEDLRAYADSCAVGRDESVPERGAVAPAYVLPDVIRESEQLKGRHYILGTFLRSVKTRYNLSWEEAWPLLKAVNQQRVQPPLNERDLHSYLKRWWRRPSADQYQSVAPAQVESATGESELAEISQAELEELL